MEMLSSRKGNILIIVLFILFLSSLSGLLITKYIKNMIDYSGEFLKYYKSYYLANAGIELEMTKVSNRGFGFEDEINKNSATNINNFEFCGNRTCFFESKVKARSSIVGSESFSGVSGCSREISFKLNKGRGIILPLFYDANSGEGKLEGINYTNFSSSEFSNLSIRFYDTDSQYYSIGVSDRNSREFLGSSDEFLKEMSSPEFNGFYDSSDKYFLIVANTENSSATERVCIKTPVTDLPTPEIKIRALGKYRDRNVSIEGRKKVQLPDYLIYNIIDN